MRFRPIHLLIGLLLFSLGFAFVAQIKIQRSDPLDGLNEDELVLLLDQLTAAESQLRDEKAELTDQIYKLQSAHSQGQAAVEAAEKERELARILGGTTPVHGPGLEIVVNQGNSPIPAQKFVTMLGELRNSGAEAIELNGNRIVAISFITSDNDGVLSLSGTELKAPYTWRVIGDADTIQPALDIARGATSQLRASDATVEITRVDDIEIDSTVAPKTYHYAKPVE